MLIFYFVLIMFIIFSGPILYKVVEKLKDKKLNRLKTTGKVIEATITKINNEAIFDRPVTVCRIFAESYIDQIKYTFISEKMYPQDCKHLKKGDIVKVLINQSNPKQYYFNYSLNNIDY